MWLWLKEQYVHKLKPRCFDTIPLFKKKKHVIQYADYLDVVSFVQQISVKK